MGENVSGIPQMIKWCHKYDHSQCWAKKKILGKNYVTVIPLPCHYWKNSLKCSQIDRRRSFFKETLEIMQNSWSNPEWYHQWHHLVVCGILWSYDTTCSLRNATPASSTVKYSYDLQQPINRRTIYDFIKMIYVKWKICKR